MRREQRLTESLLPPFKQLLDSAPARHKPAVRESLRDQSTKHRGQRRAERLVSVPGLAVDEHAVCRQVDVRDAQTRELRSAQAGAEQRLNHVGVTAGAAVLRLQPAHPRDQFGQPLPGQDAESAGAALRHLDRGERVVRQNEAVGARQLHDAAQHEQVLADDRGWRDAGGAAVVDEPAQLRGRDRVDADVAAAQRREQRPAVVPVELGGVVARAGRLQVAQHEFEPLGQRQGDGALDRLGQGLPVGVAPGHGLVDGGQDGAANPIVRAAADRPVAGAVAADALGQLLLAGHGEGAEGSHRRDPRSTTGPQTRMVAGAEQKVRWERDWDRRDGDGEGGSARAPVAAGKTSGPHSDAGSAIPTNLRGPREPKGPSQGPTDDRRTVSDLQDRKASAAIGRFVARKPAPPRLPVMSEADLFNAYGAMRQETAQ